MVRCGGSERVWLTGRRGLVTHSASNEVGDQLLCSEIERGRQSESKKGGAGGLKQRLLIWK